MSTTPAIVTAIPAPPGSFVTDRRDGRRRPIIGVAIWSHGVTSAIVLDRGDDLPALVGGSAR